MTSPEDFIDHLIAEWEQTLPDLDFASLDIMSRMLRIIRIFERDRLHVLETVGLEPWSFDTLAAIRRHHAGWATPGELAAQTVVSLGTMTTRLKSLERRGWILREPDERDRRVVKVSLTILGRTQFDAVIAEVLACQRTITSGLNPREQETFVGLLRRILIEVDDGTLRADTTARS